MKIYTAHTHPGRAPILVREGFAFGAFVFGPLWLMAQRAWIPGILLLCLVAAVWLLAPGDVRPLVSLALSVLAGLFGHDLVRWSLERQGYAEVHVLAAADEDAALARLLDRRPDLIAAALA